MPAKEASTLVDRAFAAMGDDGDPVFALAAVNRAMRLDPEVESAELRLLQGLLLTHQRRELDAVSGFDRALELDPAALDRTVADHSPREVLVEALLRLAEKRGDGDAARRAARLVDEAPNAEERLREQGRRAAAMAANQPWTGALFDLLPDSVRKSGEPPQRQPVLNGTAPAVGGSEIAEPLNELNETVIEPLRRGELDDAWENALDLAGRRGRWNGRPVKALTECDEADLLAMALAGHVAALRRDGEAAVALLRAVSCQAPFQRFFAPGTAAVVGFAGERLRILFMDEMPAMRFKRISSAAWLERNLGPRSGRRSGLIGRLFGR